MASGLLLASCGAFPYLLGYVQKPCKKTRHRR